MVSCTFGLNLVGANGSHGLDYILFKRKTKIAALDWITKPVPPKQPSTFSQRRDAVVVRMCGYFYQRWLTMQFPEFTFDETNVQAERAGQEGQRREDGSPPKPKPGAARVWFTTAAPRRGKPKILRIQRLPETLATHCLNHRSLPIFSDFSAYFPARSTHVKALQAAQACRPAYRSW